MAFLHRNRQVVAFAIMTIAIIVALNGVINNTADHLYRDQATACQRLADVMVESNQRIPAARASTQILRGFLTSARNARLAAFHQTHHPSDATAAKDYLRLAQSLDRNVHFTFIPPVNCKKVVQKP